jgi:uncharacterized phage-associated protein
MPVSSHIAAKIAGNAANWDITNLKLQKLLYIAHMMHLGKTGAPLIINENFQAWDYGPVLPSLYKKLSFFGSDNILDVFCNMPDDIDQDEVSAIMDVVNHFGHLSAGRLVNITHHHKGAWSKHYRPDVKDIIIPQADIAQEARELWLSDE